MPTEVIPLDIEVDFREPQELVTAFSSKPLEVVRKVTRKHLPHGDIRIIAPLGVLLVERKAEMDLVKSLRDKRIFTQFEASHNDGVSRAIVVEKTVPLTNLEKIVLAMVAFRENVFPFVVYDVRETVDVCIAMGRQVGQHQFVPTTRPPKSADFRLGVLQAFPRTGHPKSVKAVKVFKTLRNVLFNATEADFVAAGLPKSLYRRFQNLLDSDQPNPKFAKGKKKGKSRASVESEPSSEASESS